MNNSMVAHLWAHEQKESASGSNFFFEGTSIYSYGYHFEVGRIVKNKQGKKAYLINEDYYSATTGKHQRYVRNAIPTQAMVFSVGDNISDTGNMRFVASKLWRAVSAMHRGAEFRHGLVEDITGHQWSLNRYENDLLTAGCHRIAYNEMERIAKQLGWV